MYAFMNIFMCVQMCGDRKWTLGILFNCTTQYILRKNHCFKGQGRRVWRECHTVRLRLEVGRPWCPILKSSARSRECWEKGIRGPSPCASSDQQLASWHPVTRTGSSVGLKRGISETHSGVGSWEGQGTGRREGKLGRMEDSSHCSAAGSLSLAACFT